MNNEKIAAKHDRLHEIDALLPDLTKELNDAKEDASKRVEAHLDVIRKQLEAQFHLARQQIVQEVQQGLVTSHGEKQSQFNTLQTERQGIVSALQFAAELLDSDDIAPKTPATAP